MNDRQAAAWDRARDLRKHEPTYAEWLGELRALFPVPDELRVADAIFHFSECWVSGLTPKQAYDAFDRFATGENEFERDIDVIRQCMERT